MPQPCRAHTCRIAPIKLITFDVYTALTDLERSLVAALGPLVDGDGPSACALLGNWRTKQMEYAQISNSLGAGSVSFLQITRRSLDYALGKASIEAGATVRDELVDAWNRLDLWHEARSVIDAISGRGYELAVLSNGDADMLEALVAHNRLPFERIFSAEQAGAYKPDPAVYRMPVEALGLAPRQILHVAGSATDTMGALAAGLACAWSNRAADLLLDPEIVPDHEFDNLSGLLEVL